MKKCYYVNNLETKENKVKLIILILTTLTQYSIGNDKGSITEKIVQKSQETRKEVTVSFKDRSPANMQINNLSDFEKAMKDDKEWELEINTIIKEYK